jgi:hypothetical protein
MVSDIYSLPRRNIAAAIWLFVQLLQSTDRQALKPYHSAMIPMLIVLLPLLMGGCGNAAIGSEPSETGGDPRQGAKLIAQAGCGACHIVPGIEGANGLVARRSIRWAYA